MDITLIIISLSIFAQFVAAFLSVRLMLVTRKYLAGILIFTTIILMALRRCISLYRIMAGGVIRTDLVAEITALAISLLVLSGILYLTRLLVSSGKAIESLSVSEERFRTLAHAAFEGIAITEKGVLIDVSRQLADMLGYEIQELIGKQVIDIIAPEDRDLVSRNISIGYEMPYENRLQRKNGSVITVETRARHFTIGDRRVRVTVLRDITDRKQAEEALRESSERFRISWQTIPDSVTITTLEDGVFVDVNPGFTETFGYTREESLGKSSLKFGIWKDPEDRQRLVKDLEEHGVATLPKGRFRRKNGSEGLASVFARMIMLQNRPHLLLVAKDITEQVKTEETLRQSEERLRLALVAANQGLYDLNVRTGEATVTPEYATMLGYDPDSFRETNAKWIERLHPDDREPVAAVYQDYISGKIPFYSVEFRQKTKGGDWKWILSLGKIVEWDAEGRPLRMLGTHTDITERKQSEEALRESEKRIHDITASLGEGIYVLDREGTITFMNPMAERLWGWTMDELNETRAHNRVHFLMADGTSLPIEECRMLKVLKTGTPFSSTDEVFVRKDGTVFPISVITTPVIEGEKVVGSVTAFRDITEEKKMEAELLKTHKLESLGILAGGIAHDFNNLLQAIVGNVSLAKMLLGPEAPEGVSPLLAQAEEASEAARELSFRLLTFSKGGEPVRKTSSIGAVIRKAVSLSLSGSAVTCTVDLPPDLSPVEIDEGQMTQVFNNLLINAKEAMPQGGTIIIRGENLFLPEDSPLPLNEGAYVSVMVQDSGPGIPEEILPKIFDPYFSAKGLGSRKGSGLGLAIALSIVKKHEGHISVDSQKGRGTAFRVYLPVSKGPVEAQGGEDAFPRDLSPKRLLFMDDDERIRRLLGTMMEHLGYDYELAGSGEEALERYRRAKESGEAFDAVILDLTVQGGMGGEKAVRRLKEIDQEVRAIVSSGYADDPVMKDYRAYGFAGAIAKPYTIDKLTEVLAKV